MRSVCIVEKKKCHSAIPQMFHKYWHFDVTVLDSCATCRNSVHACRKLIINVWIGKLMTWLS